jgi:hypothetical protein
MSKKMMGVSLIMLSIFVAGCDGFSEEGENIFSKGIRHSAEFVTGLFGGNALTEEDSLKGERTFGDDKYVGTYEVSYENFTNTESLFGGSDINHDEGTEIEVSYEAEIESGEASLIWNEAESDDEERALFRGSGEYSEIIPIGGGWEYLSLEGDGVTGDIELKVEYK